MFFVVVTMLTELWLNCCKIQNVEAVSCPFTPPQSAMCQIALISDLIMAAGGNADVCAKTSFKLKFSRASLWSSWRSLSFRPLSRSTSYKRGNRKLEWKTLWSPSWTLLPSKMFEQLWNSALLSIFSPKPVLVVVMTTCFFEVGAGPWRLTLWKRFLLDPVARRDRDPNGRELPTCKYSNRRTILVVWFLFFLDDHQSMLLNRVSNLTRPGVPPPVDVFPERIGQIWGISSESAKFKPSRASQSPKPHSSLHRSVLASDRGGPPPATSYSFSKFNRGKNMANHAKTGTFTAYMSTRHKYILFLSVLIYCCQPDLH